MLSRAQVAFIGVAAVLATLFLYLGVLVEEHRTQRVDDAVLAWMHAHHTPLGTRMAYALSFMGNEALWIGGLVAAAALMARRQGPLGTQILVLCLGAAVIDSILKSIYERARPSSVGVWVSAQAWSFPSGHAMAAAAVYSFLAYLGWKRWHDWRRWAAVSAMLLLMVGVGASRLYLGVHYLSDVLAGFVAGCLWTLTVIAVSARSSRPAPGDRP